MTLFWIGISITIVSILAGYLVNTSKPKAGKLLIMSSEQNLSFWIMLNGTCLNTYLTEFRSIVPIVLGEGMYECHYEGPSGKKGVVQIYISPGDNLRLILPPQ